MSSFGETLRNAREAKGLTCSQVAAQTHMLVQTVEEMEKEDFHRIPAPIYGRGFVRLFAECVGLDPVPLVREFMDIYEGRRAPIVRTREVPVAPPPPPVVTPPKATTIDSTSPSEAHKADFTSFAPPTTLSEKSTNSLPEFEQMSMPAPEPEPVLPEPEPVLPEPEPVLPEPEPVLPEPEPVLSEPEPASEPMAEAPVKHTVLHEAPPVVRGLELFEQATTSPLPSDKTPHSRHEDSSPSKHETTSGYDSPFLSSSAYDEGGPSAADRFRRSLSIVSSGVISKVRSIPKRTWRIALLSVASIIVLTLLVWGIMALYKATSTSATSSEKPVETSAVTPAKQVAEQAQTAKPADKSADKAPQPVKKAASKTKPTDPLTLKTTGQKIPPLYAD